MGLRDVLLVLHIAAAGVWLGTNIVQAIAPRMIGRHGSTALAAWYRVASSLSRPVYIPSGIVLLATGIWMVLLVEGYSFGSLFVTIGFGMIVIGAVIGSAVIDPSAKAAAGAAEENDESRLSAAAGRMTAFGVLDTVLLLFTITVMVLRLGA